MTAAKFDIKDIPRGTNPPFKITLVRADGSVYPLATPFGGEGCTISMVVREESWEDSLTDTTALMKRKCRFWNVPNIAALPDLAAATGDICWVDETASIRVYDGTAWKFGTTDENKIMQGEYTIRFTREEFMIPVGTHYYSIDIRFPNGEVTKLVRGKIKISPNTVNEI
jgi:hypothetical protein